MSDSKNNEKEAPSSTLSRRTFLAGVGGIGLGALLATGAMKALQLSDQVYAVEASGGYLLVDTKKCSGCESCMLACSLAHTGKSNVNLSRIQLSKNPLGMFPYDIVQNQCRQCPYPACVDACPVGAMYVDPETGVRTIAEEKCIGCERCIAACPFTPSRVQWNYEERHAQKCDLCLNTPFFNEKGGPEGKQACVEVCPMKAITFTRVLPTQTDSGYMVNLRNEHWAIVGFPIDDEGKVLPSVSVPSI